MLTLIVFMLLLEDILMRSLIYLKKTLNYIENTTNMPKP